MKSNFREYITFRSLEQKFTCGNSLDTLQRLVDGGALTRMDENGKVVRITSLEEAAPDVIKNLCAKVPAVLVDQLDQISQQLGINKRDFVEQCLWEGLSQAREIYEELGVGEYLADFYSHEEASEEARYEGAK